MDVMLLTSWSMIYGNMGEFNHTKEYLKKAKDLAKKFDNAPDFSINNVKYFYGKNEAFTDNFGMTAIEGILKTIHLNEDIKKELMEIWEELEVEDKERGFNT